MRKNISVSFREVLFASEHFVVLALSFFVGVSLIACPGQAKKSVEEALTLCGETVIASLFPFLFLSTFISESEIIGSGGRLLSFISRKLFALPADAAVVFILSALGGFPVGAKMTSSLLDKGKISENTAKRLIAACVSPSPSFAVTAVGLSFFASAKTGIIIYASVVISNLIILFLSRFVFKSDEKFYYSKRKVRPKISSAFVSAGNKASEAIISICCYVILFSCLCDVMKNFIADETVLAYLCGLFEVTTGCERLSAISNVPLIAGVIGWGGLSVHFQILSDMEKSGVGLKLFFAARTICASLSVLICDALLRIFPTAVDAIAMKENLMLRTTQSSTALSIMMLLSCFMFLIGDYTVKIRSERKKRTTEREM